MASTQVRQRAPQREKDAPLDGTTTNVVRDSHPAGPVRHGPAEQALRVLLFVVYFNSALLMIFVTQLIGIPLYFWRKDIYYPWMALTKKHFALVLIAMSKWWSPTKIRVTGDKSVCGELRKTDDGRLETTFPERMVLIANHQIYTDWVYLWWTAYASNMHGHLFIILKESLRWIPIVGWGMQFFSFIFMSRKWASDQSRLKHRLQKLNRTASGQIAKDQSALDPMWLLIFPEGTNLSKNGRASSAKWSAKSGIPDMRHELLPRHTGLLFCLRELRQTVDWVYDCTLSYEGIPRGEYGQDIFGLWSTYFEGRPPKSIHLHWRKFAVADIPLDDDNAFEAWLHQRWLEKDDLLELFMRNGQFPADREAVATTNENANSSSRDAAIVTEVKLKSILELAQIPMSSATVVMVVNLMHKMLAFIRIVVGSEGPVLD